MLGALLANAATQAGVNKWTSLGPDGGGISKIVLPSAPGYPLYAAAGSGFFRSADGGSHWLQSNDDAARYGEDFAVDPQHPDRVYLVTRLGPPRVLISVDAGATFFTFYTFPSGTAATTPVGIAVSADGNTLYTANRGTHSNEIQVFRSTDGGQTWLQGTILPATVDAQGPKPGGLQVDPSDSKTLYVVQPFSLRVTHDGGATWSDITPVPGVLDGFAMDPGDTRRLWVSNPFGLNLSTDRGATWSIVQSGPKSAVTLDPSSPSIVYTATYDGVVLKGSAGTWTDISGNLGSYAPNAIAVSPQDSSRLFVANVGALWASTNGGGSWVRSDTGLVASYVASIVPSSVRNRVYLDGGFIGELQDGSDAVTVLNADTLFQALGTKTSNLDVIAPVSEPSGGLIAAAQDHLAITVDDGLTWSPLSFPAITN